MTDNQMRWILYNKARYKAKQQQELEQSVSNNKIDSNIVPNIPAPDYNFVVPDEAI